MLTWPHLTPGQGHTIFHNVVYLGNVVVHNPKDETAIQQHMAIMNQVTNTFVKQNKSFFFLDHNKSLARSRRAPCR